MSASSSLSASRADRDPMERVIDQLGQAILGKERQLRLAVTCLLAQGHLLIEDLPGVGKTTLAHAIAQVLGLQFQRIQFTSDLLPADILGASIYERDTGRFQFHPGPIFAQVILADEVNRATPKAQSALLESMEEQQVTVEGTTMRLPEPFFVIATQNPSFQIGTFPLPESQLDRFLMRVELGYPDRRAERQLLEGEDRRALVASFESVLPPDELKRLQQAVPRVHTAAPLLDYVQALVQFTRESNQFLHGLSPRAALALLRSAQAWALLHRRDHALVEDVQAVMPAVAGHRLRPSDPEALEGLGQPLVEDLLEAVPIP